MPKPLNVANMETIELLDNDRAIAVFLQKAIDSKNPELMAEALKAATFAYGLIDFAELGNTEFKKLCEDLSSPKDADQELQNVIGTIIYRLKIRIETRDFQSD